MTPLVMLLLASGFVTLCSCTDRTYHLINETMTWDEAQSYCRREYWDLATVANQDDMNKMVSLTAAGGVKKEIWIGLKETGPASWLWSVGETRENYGLTEYTNWETEFDFGHKCAVMMADGKWRQENCKATRPYVCQTAVGSTLMNVTNENKAWREAQALCRKKSSDLVTVRSQTENQALQHAINLNLSPSSPVWIGLFKDEWKWSDQSNSSFRHWEKSQPNLDGICVLYNPGQKTWYDRGCEAKYYFYCESEKRQERQQYTVKLALKSDTLTDVNNDAVQEAILNQLREKFPGATFRWKNQPNGKVFQKEKKKGDHEPFCPMQNL